MIKRIAFCFAWIIIISACFPVLVISPLKELSLKKPAISSFVAEKSKEEYAKSETERQKIIIKHQDAGEYEGKYVSSAGLIVSAKDTGRVTFLNFEKDYKKGLVLVIFAKDYKRFREKPLTMYKGKYVEFEGRVKIYKGRPEIIIKSSDQIKIIKN